MCSLNHKQGSRLSLRVHSNIQHVFLLQCCCILIIPMFTAPVTAYFWLRSLAPWTHCEYNFHFGTNMWLLLATLPSPGLIENAPGTLLRRAAKACYGESTTAHLARYRAIWPIRLTANLFKRFAIIQSLQHRYRTTGKHHRRICFSAELWH